MQGEEVIEEETEKFNGVDGAVGLSEGMIRGYGRK
jgi:hypothetical protein